MANRKKMIDIVQCDRFFFLKIEERTAAHNQRLIIRESKHYFCTESQTHIGQIRFCVKVRWSCINEGHRNMCIIFVLKIVV